MKRFLPVAVVIAVLLMILVGLAAYHYGVNAGTPAASEQIRPLEERLAEAESRIALLSQQNERIKAELETEKSRSDSKTLTIVDLQRQLADIMKDLVDAPDVPAISFDEKVRLLIAKLAEDDAWYYRDKLIEMGEEVIPFILARLEEPDVTEDESLMLYQILARFGDPELVPWFIAGLVSDSQRVRRECHRALMRLTYQTLPADYDEWALWYATNAGLDPDQWHDSAINNALTALASGNARERSDGLMFLFRRLMEGDDELAADPRVLSALADLAQSESPSIRRSALMMLARVLPDDQVLVYVTPLLDSSDNPTDRAAAVMALGRPGLTGAIPTLEPLLSDPDSSVKRAAFFSIARVGGEEAKQTLSAALQQAKDAGEDTRGLEFILNAMNEGRLQRYPFAFGAGPGGGRRSGRPSGIWGFETGRR